MHRTQTVSVVRYLLTDRNQKCLHTLRVRFVFQFQSKTCVCAFQCCAFASIDLVRPKNTKYSTNVQLDQRAGDYCDCLHRMCVNAFSSRSISFVPQIGATSVSGTSIVASATTSRRTKFQSRIWNATVYDDAIDVSAEHELRWTDNGLRSAKTGVWPSTTRLWATETGIPATSDAGIRSTELHNETDHTQAHLRSHTTTWTRNDIIKALPSFQSQPIIFLVLISDFKIHRAPLTAAPPQKHYKIVFIKAPAPPTPTVPNIPVQPLDEEKTLVYVLVKKPDDPPRLVIPTPASTLPSKPEVYFIRYKSQVCASEGSRVDVVRIG